MATTLELKSGEALGGEREYGCHLCAPRPPGGEERLPCLAVPVVKEALTELSTLASQPSQPKSKGRDEPHPLSTELSSTLPQVKDSVREKLPQ